MLEKISSFFNYNNKKLYSFLFFFVIFTIGLNSVDDYGATLDDQFYFQNGLNAYSYAKNNILSFLNILIANQSAGTFNEWPTTFELILVFISDILNLNDLNKIYLLGHYLNFTIFFLSLILLFRLINKRFNSTIMSYIGISVLFLSPRIFAEAYYNWRDIFFLSLFIFFISSVYQYLFAKNLRSIILLALTSSLLIITKILGVLPPIIFILLYIFDISFKDNKKKEIKNLIVYFLLTIFFIYIFWPYLWSSPIDNLFFAFTNILKTHEGLVLINYYFGEYISSNTSPWHYRIVWFLITTPIVIVVLFFLGFTSSLLKILIKLINYDDQKNLLWNTKNEIFDYLIFFILILTIFVAIKFNTSKFGGWRHLYFLYPTVIYFSIIFITNIKKVLFKKFIYISIIVNFIYVSMWSFLNHPYQYVFFNFPSKQYVKKNFELDWWGVSNLDSLKYILKNDKKEKIKIQTISFSSLDPSIALLASNQKDRLVLTSKYEDAEFLIDHYSKKTRGNFVIEPNQYEKYYEIIVNGIPINTVYKKITR